MSLLLRNAIKSNFALKPFNALRQSSQLFSTLPPPPPHHQDDPSPIDPFLQTAGQGVVYGKLFGITRHTLKTDVINLLGEGCQLTPDDIKLTYASYDPVAVMIQFPTRQAFDNAFKTIGKKGRLHRLERADRSQWDYIMPYDGKTVLLQGIPEYAAPEDVERFLSGCEFDSSSIRLFRRQSVPEAIRVALVRFHTRTAAMNAFITKNQGFCSNNKISMRVLQ
ncbi:uncharacterized protein LOC8283856 [Ricinus communis]|uniref:Uncharacterized protein n=1 Tax=Ricinus communis TaxID=3988 RepID=B9SGU6_RICCO|nr:uncharacterized protein LOC8283856 [Ricinus communis]EEF37181.1 conserved hypothetical protein [Ricinus communis]|eukprot:XP_002525215.1 uncharacterized protein LOC8283856 [Ricinus communis]